MSAGERERERGARCMAGGDRGVMSGSWAAKLGSRLGKNPMRMRNEFRFNRAVRVSIRNILKIFS